MKFVKVVIDGKEYYERIDDASGEYGAFDGDPEIIDAEIEGAKEPSGAEKFKQDTADFIEKFNNGAKEFGEKVAASAKNIGGKISDGAKDLGKRIKTGTERLFSRDKSIDPKSTEARLLRLLPYMSAKEAHEVAEKLIANDTSLSKLNISTIMPFLSASDCDAVFKKCIELNNTGYDLAAVVPYVSVACLSEIVDGYVGGKYPELDIDLFYPFLGDEEIKRIFYHIINSEKSE
jgi:hypothetical protein